MQGMDCCSLRCPGQSWHSHSHLRCPPVLLAAPSSKLRAFAKHLSWRLVCQLPPHVGDEQGFTPPRKSPRTLTVFSSKEPAPPAIAAPVLWSAFLSPSMQQDSRFMCTWSGRLFKARRVSGSSAGGCWGCRALPSSHVGSGSF